jgi:hypothetical protein
MRLTKHFEAERTDEQDWGHRQDYVTIQLVERENAVDMLVHDEGESRDDVYRIRFQDKEPIEEISSLIARYLHSNSSPAVSTDFMDAEMEELDVLYWEDKDMKNALGIDRLSFSISEHRDRYVMWLIGYDEEVEPHIKIPVATKNDENEENAIELLEFLRDFSQSGVLWDKEISWDSIPESLSSARIRIESAEKKRYRGNLKGAVAETREAFHSLRTYEDRLKQELSEEKVNDIFRSVDGVVDFGLHSEDREEDLTKEDVDFVLSSVADLLVYIARSLEKPDR